MPTPQESICRYKVALHKAPKVASLVNTGQLKTSNGEFICRVILPATTLIDHGINQNVSCVGLDHPDCPNPDQAK